MDLPATVHLDLQVDFLPTVPGLTVQLITVINTGKTIARHGLLPPKIVCLCVNRGC